MYSPETPPYNSLPETATVNPEDTRAMHIMLEFSQTHVAFDHHRLNFLGQVLGARKGEGPVTMSEIEQLDASDLPYILEHFQAIYDAAQPKKPLSRSAINRLGLYLCGLNDAKIWEVYGSAKSTGEFTRERQVFKDALGKDYKSPETQAVLHERRAQAIGQLIANKVLHGSRRQRSEQAASKNFNLAPQKLRVYPARETLTSIEQQLQQKNILPPESEGQLVKHFMEPYQPTAIAEKHAVATSLQILRRLYTTRFSREPVPPVRAKLFNSLKLLETLLGTGATPPISRAVYMRHQTTRYPQINHQALIEQDNRRLDIALSWLFQRDEPQESRPEQAAS